MFLIFPLVEGLTYKESFQKSWEDNSLEDNLRVKDLPNFDPDIFYEISGIDLRDLFPKD